jgi:fatty acid synthase
MQYVFGFKGGTLQQKISSCLEVLNGFMMQSYPVVASMVVAEKCGGSAGSGNIVDRVSNVLGKREWQMIFERL